MEQGDGGRPQSYRCNITTPHTLHRVSPLVHERQCSVLRIGDIWIPKLSVSPNHFIKLYIPSGEYLFPNGNHFIRVEHNGWRSRIISWRIWRNPKERWQFQQESTNEQKNSILPFDIMPLRPTGREINLSFWIESQMTHGYFWKEICCTWVWWSHN
jgi:hypothetical protein